MDRQPTPAASQRVDLIRLSSDLPGLVERIGILQRTAYPDWMIEPNDTYRDLLGDGRPGPCSYGAVTEPNARSVDALVGWTVLDLGKSKREFAYLYDLVVIPEWRRRGIGRLLWRQTLRDCRWHGLAIELHARSVSYRLLANPEFAWEEGFRITTDVFQPRHYNLDYNALSEPDEHAHFLRLDPIGRKYHP